MNDEYFPIVDEKGLVTGKAKRSECHSGTFLLHPVVHLHVLNSGGLLYLQKRAEHKDTQPGKWDTAVGGHVDYGETIEEALIREVREELGITGFKPEFLLRYRFTSEIETELVHIYITQYDGIINPAPSEITEGRFWTLEEIDLHLNGSLFTPNFVNEYTMLKERGVFTNRWSRT